MRPVILILSLLSRFMMLSLHIDSTMYDQISLIRVFIPVMTSLSGTKRINNSIIKIINMQCN
jgi:hypothetical protein